MARMLAALGLVMAALISPVAAQTSPGTVLITGASQGHGLAFVEDYAARGWRVIATARSPDSAAELQALAAKNSKIAVERLDITDFAQVDALAAKYKGTAIDVLNLNGAINSFRVGVKPFGPLDPTWLSQVLNTNVTAQLYVAEAFLEHVAASRQKKIAVMSAVGGSITNVRNATAPAYRASKAALNMLMRAYGEQVKPRGVAVLIIAPGTIDVRNAMGAPDPAALPDRDRRMVEARAFAPRTAIGSMIDLIDRLTVADIGTFHQWDGKTLPW
ncbi:MAG: SDR family NAD(P)-dependent oxidoreductase [Rhodospirillaceae bacterium]|nr:SDR family NAD(P)-dependent oxidoreductase [Rhodospirillaceae bacterium]